MLGRMLSCWCISPIDRVQCCLATIHTSQLSRKEHLTENTEVLVTVHQIPDDTVDTLMRCIDGNLNGL